MADRTSGVGQVPGDGQDTLVTACETRPGRLVFTEEDNTDAWIATDLAVDVER
jgi:hypothetical protein